jgi:hypothetical protein
MEVMGTSKLKNNEPLLPKSKYYFTGADLSTENLKSELQGFLNQAKDQILV